MEIKLKLNGEDVVLNISDITVNGKPVCIDNNEQVNTPEFKDGDFVSLYNIGNECRFLIIYKSDHGRHAVDYHAAVYNVYNVYCENRVISHDDWCICDDTRIATEEEKQFLLDVLHANGKDWDADNKQIVDYKWKPKLGEKYFSFDCYMQPACFVWTKTQNDEQYYLANKCFKTLEEAKKYAKKFSETLKNREL